MARILIADDSFFMRSILKDIIIKHGLTVSGEASNGNEAIRLYKELLPDMVLMDISMKECDGLKAMKEIRDSDPQASIIVCSVMGQQCMIQDAVKLGAKDFIVKPFTDERVIEAINRALKNN